MHLDGGNSSSNNYSEYLSMNLSFKPNNEATADSNCFRKKV